MKLFARSTADNLAAARQSLAAAEAKIVELETQRTVKLPDADITEMQKIDSELATHRHAASIYHDRVASLINRQRQEERERLEKEKVNKISETSRRLAHWRAAAQQVDEAAAALQSAVQNLDRADTAVFGDSAVRNYLSARSIAALADRAAGPRDEPGINEARRVIGPLRRIANSAPYGLADEVEDRGRRLIEFLENEPIPEPEAYDNETEAA